ncbi:E3 ubiquitin-protein ligase Ufd4 [Gryllus bimaculatus]|nr:E3 ubiquitin-protein ligase Ufd4 [Gryllus bimaculatus]
MEAKNCEKLQVNATLEERLTNMEKRFTKIEGRLTKMEEVLQRVMEKKDILAEESLQRNLSILMPKVEELLASHKRATSTASSQNQFHPAQPSSLATTSSTNLAPSLNTQLAASTTIDAMFTKGRQVNEPAALGPPAHSLQGAPPFASPSRDAPKSLFSAQPSPPITTTLPTPTPSPPLNIQLPASATTAEMVTECCQGNVPNVGPPAHSMQGAAASSSPSTDTPKSLLEAVKKGDVAALRRFLAAGSRVNARDERGNTALHLAASNGRTELVDVLIANGAGVDNWANQRRTPLHCAAANGYSATVARLVGVGAAVEARDARGATARVYEVAARLTVWLALVDPRAEIGRSLRVAANAEVVWIFADAARDVVLGEAGIEALVASAADGRQEALRALLQLGVNANATDTRDSTALLNAAYAGHASCVRSLVEAGANVNVLIHTATNGKRECVVALLEAGAQVNVKNRFGNTPLHLAAMYGKRECVVALLEGGADANIRLHAEFGSTALEYARQNNHQDCVLEIERRLVQRRN